MLLIGCSPQDKAELDTRIEAHVCCWEPLAVRQKNYYSGLEETKNAYKHLMESKNEDCNIVPCYCTTLHACKSAELYLILCVHNGANHNTVFLLKTAFSAERSPSLKVLRPHTHLYDGGLANMLWGGGTIEHAVAVRCPLDVAQPAWPVRVAHEVGVECDWIIAGIACRWSSLMRRAQMFSYGLTLKHFFLLK